MTNEKVTLTEREEELIRIFLKETNYTPSEVDITKTFEENNFEYGEHASFLYPEREPYGFNFYGILNNIDSLAEKKLIRYQVVNDSFSEFAIFIIIGKVEFESIKAILK